MKVLVVLSLIAACAALPNLSLEPVYSHSLKDELYPRAVVQQAQTKLMEAINVNIDKFFDNALDAISTWLKTNNMDPMVTPDIIKKFSKKVGVVTFHGELDLTKGSTTGISTVKRNDAAILTYEKQILNMRVPITFDSIDLKFDYHAELMDIKANGGVEGKVTDLELHIDVMVDTKTTDIVLNEFKITHAGNIDVKFTGNKAVDWFMDFIADIATGVFHDSVQQSLESGVKDLVQQEIDYINNVPKIL